MDYRKESEFWLIHNRQKVAKDLSKGSSNAMAALLVLLEQPDGARAFKEMKDELSSEEWGKLYLVCIEEPSRIISSILAINALAGSPLVHRNLELKYPAQFARESIRNFYEVGERERWRIEKRLREEFIKSYNEIKLLQ